MSPMADDHADEADDAPRDAEAGGQDGQGPKDPFRLLPPELEVVHLVVEGLADLVLLEAVHEEPQGAPQEEDRRLVAHLLQGEDPVVARPHGDVEEHLDDLVGRLDLILPVGIAGDLEGDPQPFVRETEKSRTDGPGADNGKTGQIEVEDRPAFADEETSGKKDRTDGDSDHILFINGEPPFTAWQILL